MRLWAEGFDDWQSLLDQLERAPLGSANRSLVERELVRSLEAFEAGDCRYFSSVLGIKDAWRAFTALEDKCLYLDIETDGGNRGSSVTLVGVYDGADFRGFVKYKDLEEFPELLAQKQMIVTFYGDGFDVPMLRKKFPDLDFPHVHFDLCPTLRRLGLKGGLKKIEKQLGISRGEETDGLNGFHAVQLWNRYQNLDDERSLELLIEYNREDVVNLQYLARYASQRLEQGVFLGHDLQELKK